MPVFYMRFSNHKAACADGHAVALDKQAHGDDYGSFLSVVRPR